MQTQNCNFCQDRVHPTQCPAACAIAHVAGAARDKSYGVEYHRASEPVRSINSGGIAVPADFIYV